MRAALAIFVAMVAPLAAAELDQTYPYVGWGGPGGQMFRSKVMIVRNSNYNARRVLLVVDDIERRGDRLGIQRVAVEYQGGTGVSDDVLKSIHEKVYEYPLMLMYPVVTSPKMAQLVIPCARGVTARFKFYRTLHRRMRESDRDRDLVPEMTRVFDCDALQELPWMNPMREKCLRKPRASDPGGDQAGDATAQDGSGEAAEAPRRPLLARWLPAGQGEAPAGDGSAGAEAPASDAPASDASGAVQAGAGISPGPAPSAPAGAAGPETPVAPGAGPDGEGDGPVEPRPAPAPARGPTARRVRSWTPPAEEVEDTPQMIAARQRAEERIRRMGLQVGTNVLEIDGSQE